jgi:hypothetical protein
MPIERAPKSPLPQNYVPPESMSYKVKDGDNWQTVAAKFKLDAGKLIDFNFKTNDPAEVNWYLRRNIGCNKPSADGRNWAFSASAKPGFVYIPTSPAKKVTPTVVSKAPTKDCKAELDAANETLRKSQEIAATIVRPRATSDLPYWFARLYQYITLYEIQERDKLTYPCFVLHFIPIFYDTYLVAADAYMKSGNIPVHWQGHFNLAGLYVDSTNLEVYFNAVERGLTSGVTAHIQGDMAPSLEKAYRSFSAKYSGVPPFDTYKQDFFENNKPVFEKVRLTLVNELVNRATGLAAMGRKPIDPKFASDMAERLGRGLNIDEIYRWREEAWATARKNLEGH